jgi:hypothetical protein
MDLQLLGSIRVRTAGVQDDGIGRREALQLAQGGTSVVSGTPTQAAAALEGGWEDGIGGRETQLGLLETTRLGGEKSVGDDEGRG